MTTKCAAKLTDREFDQLLAEAAKLGTEAGVNAAAWWEQDAIGGRATRGERETAECTLKGLENGDPETIDSLPFPNLSGEWADEQVPEDIYRELGVQPEPEDEQDICEAWETAASDAVVSEVERLCREFLA